MTLAKIKLFAADPSQKITIKENHKFCRQFFSKFFFNCLNFFTGDWMIVIMTDESQKWGGCLRDVQPFWFLPLFPLPICLMSACSPFPPPSLFATPALVLILYEYIPLLYPSNSWYFLLSSFPCITLAYFCPCPKECFSNRKLLHNGGHYANLSFIQCI